MSNLQPRQFGSSAEPKQPTGSRLPRHLTGDIINARGRVQAAGAEIPPWLQRSYGQPGRKGL